MADGAETLRAAIEVAFPGGDGIPAGLDVRADVHVRDALEGFLPGSVNRLAALLDAQAAERGATDGFAALPPAERAEVFRSMLSEEIPDLRELAESVVLFGAGAIFSEWNSYDRATGELERPAAWDRI